MSNQAKDSFKLLWPFQNVRTLKLNVIQNVKPSNFCILNPEISQFQDSACDRGNKIFRELDVNGDGELSEDEFVKGQII